jgi:glycosyltransferase involved in cell wall biosynthesis
MDMKKPVLFIFNGVIKAEGNISISGGDMRLFEVIKQTVKERVHLLTNVNGDELAERFGVPYSKKYIIDYVVDSGMWTNLIISLKSLFWLPRGAAKFKEGIVYGSCEHLYDVLPALRLKLFNRCDWYAVCHQVVDYPWKDMRGNTPRIIRYVYWCNVAFSVWLIKMFADRVLAVSDQTTEKLICIKKVSSEKITTVYGGVDVEGISGICTQYQDEKDSAYDAVFIGRLNHNKGAFDLLKIWHRVCQAKHGARLVIIGDGSSEIIATMKAFITQYNLQDNIILQGPVYDVEKKIRIVNSARLFIFPSHQENWGLVIGEAMASNTPVLAHALPEITPIWGDHVEWVDVGDTASFAQKVLLYLDNDEKRSMLARSAFDFVQRYDWNEVVKDDIR